MTVRRGRRKLPPERKCSACIMIRLTPTDAQALDRLANRYQISLSELVKRACRHMLLDERGAKIVVSG